MRVLLSSFPVPAGLVRGVVVGATGVEETGEETGGETGGETGECLHRAMGAGVPLTAVARAGTLSLSLSNSLLLSDVYRLCSVLLKS